MGEPAGSGMQPAVPVKVAAWVFMEQIELQSFIDESRKFQAAVSLDMVAVKGELKNILTRLDKINGSVGRHDAEIKSLQRKEEVETAVAKASELADQRAAVAIKAATDRAEQVIKDAADKMAEEKKAAAETFKTWIQPSIQGALKLGLIGLVVYILSRGTDILNFFSKVAK